MTATLASAWLATLATRIGTVSSAPMIVMGNNFRLALRTAMVPLWRNIRLVQRS